MKIAKKVLLVDDDETSAFITQRVFKRAQVEADLLLAQNGQEALDIVRQVCEQEECPELILLDINMPVMNGFEFLEELQNSADLSIAPMKIVILSSSDHHIDMARAKNYPVIDFIQKPITLEKLEKFL